MTTRKDMTTQERLTGALADLDASRKETDKVRAERDEALARLRDRSPDGFTTKNSEYLRAICAITQNRHDADKKIDSLTRQLANVRARCGEMGIDADRIMCAEPWEIDVRR